MKWFHTAETKLNTLCWHKKNIYIKKGSKKSILTELTIKHYP